MAENSRFAQSDISHLRKEYETPYNAIIREHIVMGVPRYFLERWVPILGPATATVVNTLRQLNYHTPERTLTISGKSLAREACVSRRHLYTCLETPWIEAFVRVIPGKRTRTPEGKIVQETNSYHIHGDDPLTPNDAEHLMLHLRTLADTPIEAATIALKQRGRDLWAPDTAIPNHFQAPQPIRARMVLEHAFPNWSAHSVDEEETYSRLAEELHHLVTLGRPDGRTSKIIVPHYFRTHWWKKLGHDLAWSYLWLRGSVYENPNEGITRHTCWIPSLDVLLRLINRPREWWRRNVDQCAKTVEDGAPADFFQQIDFQKGRDPAHPQLVARQFLVRVDLPIAPDDRLLYSNLLNTWITDSMTSPREDTKASFQPHTVTLESPYSDTFSSGPTHSNTLTVPESDTFRHTKPSGVAHIRAQGYTTHEHRESESLKVFFENSSFQNNKSFSKPRAAKKVAAGHKSQTDQPGNLVNAISSAFSKNSQQPLHELVSPSVLLQEAWPEAVSPHSPAWRIVANGKISGRDLLALMLAVWGDGSIKYPPRYLSWLLLQWQVNPDVPPVTQWPRWKDLADLPLIEWPRKGYREWTLLAQKNRYMLPFGLETIMVTKLETVDASPTPENFRRTASSGAPVTVHDEDRASLDEHLGGHELTVSDIWQVALSRLSAKLHRAVYTNWLVGSKPIAYRDGKLIVRARHFMAREQLSRRYNGVIEATVSDLAKQPVQICYVL